MITKVNVNFNLHVRSDELGDNWQLEAWVANKVRDQISRVTNAAREDDGIVSFEIINSRVDRG